MSERMLTFQSCQKCNVNRQTHEKMLAELLGIISAAATYVFRSVTVFQCLKLGFSHTNFCMVLPSDNSMMDSFNSSLFEWYLLFLHYFDFT